MHNWYAPHLEDHYRERRALWISRYLNSGIFARPMCRKWALHYSELVRGPK